jgi:cytochrome c-type biogenesis protein
MDLVFGYLAGLLTLINPCVLPVLPIVVASALQAHRLGPLALAAGMAGSFVALGFALTAFGPAIGLGPDRVAEIGAVLMIGFGVLLFVPSFGARFAAVTAPLAAGADRRIDTLDRGGLGGQLATGALLGAVWSPCIGPTLGGAIGLASQGQSLGLAFAIMTAFGLGVATLILALGYGARGALMRRRALMMRMAELGRPIMGAALVLVGTAILLRWHHVIEAWAVENLPAWLIDLSVSI